MEGLEEKAKASGACQLVVKDLKEEFVKDFIFPCLRAGAIYERKYLLGTSMARPVIAKVKHVDERVKMMYLYNVKLQLSRLHLYFCFFRSFDLFLVSIQIKSLLQKA